MNKSNHTPTPWRVDRMFPGQIVAGPITETPRGKMVTSIATVLGSLLPCWKANQEIIVKAVNHHEELVAALKQAESTLNCAVANERGYDGKTLAYTLADEAASIREVLAKLEGGAK